MKKEEKKSLEEIQKKEAEEKLDLEEFCSEKYNWVDSTKKLLIKIMTKLPKEVLEHIINNNVEFREIGEGCGMAIKNDLVSSHIVLSDTVSIDIVAHEIAHSFLGHKEVLNKTIKQNWMEDKEADDLTEKWGFKRTYNTYGE